MRGNSHVRFLGGKGVAILLTYPIISIVSITGSNGYIGGSFFPCNICCCKAIPQVVTILICGSPRKLDNLNRCKMACKLTQERPFYEKILRQQIQESRSA